EVAHLLDIERIRRGIALRDLLPAVVNGRRVPALELEEISVGKARGFFVAHGCAYSSPFVRRGTSGSCHVLRRSLFAEIVEISESGTQPATRKPWPRKNRKFSQLRCWLLHSEQGSIPKY